MSKCRVYPTAVPSSFLCDTHLSHLNPSRAICVPVLVPYLFELADGTSSWWPSSIGKNALACGLARARQRCTIETSMPGHHIKHDQHGSEYKESSLSPLYYICLCWEGEGISTGSIIRHYCNVAFWNIKLAVRRVRCGGREDQHAVLLLY